MVTNYSLAWATGDGGGFPTAAWGLLGAIGGSAMAMLGGYLVSRSQLRARLAQSNRIEIYEPALRELRKVHSLLQHHPFPETVVTDAPSPAVAMARVRHGERAVDVSWWTRQKDAGAHLRIAPSVALRLDNVADNARAYKELKHEFFVLVAERLREETNERHPELKEKYGEKASRLYGDEKNFIIRKFLTNDRTNAIEHLDSFFGNKELAEVLATAFSDDPVCVAVRDAAANLKLAVSKALAVIESQIRTILKKYEKRNDKV